MKYPLKPLLEQRRREVEDATSSLGDAIRGREAAEIERAGAVQEHASAEEKAAALGKEERARLERGELKAIDLARGSAWAVSAREETAILAANAAASADRLDEKAMAEAAAQGDLAQKMAKRDVIVKDETRFDDRVRARTLASEEEAAEEARRGR